MQVCINKCYASKRKKEIVVHYLRNSTMARLHLTLWFSYSFFVFCITSLRGTTDITDEERKVYIVYMGSLPKQEYSPSMHHINILQEVVHSRYQGQSLIRSYTRSFNGFVAHLTQEEQQNLAAHEGVVSIFPSKTLQFYTTKSWDFMGFPQDLHRNLYIESDVIIGVLDSGIWPESKSFSDQGFGRVSEKWTGVCNGGRNFTCNNKIIGARYYGLDDFARDIDGHGSHTASIAAGNSVENTSYYDITQGTVRGGVPSARVAIYKACTPRSCSEADILSAFDDAIADGVDIITASLGPEYPFNLERDAIAIGSFHAAQKGILTVNAAGNNGFTPGHVTSTAPWLFTVAASTTNRKIISRVILGNGTSLAGNSVNSFDLNGTKFPLVYGRDASGLCGDLQAKRCDLRCLDEKLVRGKIILCRSNDRAILEASRVGAIGLILQANEADDVSFVFPYATSVLSDEDFKLVESYYNSTENPQVNILKSEVTENLGSPTVASFSSRGPNSIFPDILKPDISAPGVDILAAFSPASSPSGYPGLDKRSAPYNILLGTSMACPHVTGAAAYVKSLHPDWSPSAIKSALMTTAWRMNATNSKYGDSEFSYGAGHLDPMKASNPGIVYETLKEDYIKMVCSLNSSIVMKIFGDNTTCTGIVPKKSKDLNYPTMSAQVGERGAFVVKFQRTVTNVGLSNSTYNATITSTSQCNITVVPNILSFRMLNEKQSFVVTVSGERVENMISASLEWSDGIHIARSPIVVYTGNHNKN
ncbi:hypothetical protein ACH5RR_036747 [Cinchona calisaya]|uniref:Cucumisin n=1 Tax=Cinchona calisaya TaxID=153742 RepID=A0ABD2Y5E0_9GENT